MMGLVRQVLYAVAVLIGFTASASAAAIAGGPADTVSMMLIGGGLLLGSSIARSKIRRN